MNRRKTNGTSGGVGAGGWTTTPGYPIRYTDDCVYRDPNTRGAVSGREALARYLTKLFRQWNMT